MAMKRPGLLDRTNPNQNDPAAVTSQPPSPISRTARGASPRTAWPYSHQAAVPAKARKNQISRRRRGEQHQQNNRRGNSRDQPTAGMGRNRHQFTCRAIWSPVRPNLRWRV